METNILFGISLTASFLAGVLALFAPCCITFLFPSYLGTIFKDNKKVMLYTLVFAIGLAFVLVPVALGLRFLIYFLDEYHKQVYYTGAAVLILMGIMTIKPLFHIPQFFHTKPDISKNINIGSVFGLGLMSGLTSACCAPVLFAAVTLTSLSPTLFQALVVSLSYVLGIVFPLFIISLFYKRTTSKISGHFRHTMHIVFQYLGASIFIVTGILVAIFNYLDKIQMKQMEGYSNNMRMAIFQISKYVQNPLIDIGIFLIVIFIFYKLLRKASQSID